jgi:hypothetical protein
VSATSPGHPQIKGLLLCTHKFIQLQTFETTVGPLPPGTATCFGRSQHGGKTSCHALGTIGKPSMGRCALSWFHNVSTYDGEVIEY